MSDWTLTEDDGIAVLTFARPPRNFMSFAAITELGERLRELGERTDVSVVVLTGGLPGYFVAHADLEDLGRLGGCELALACAARVAARSATLAQPEVAAGIIPGAGGTQRLPRLVGPGRALELVLTARVVAAEEAAAIGLVEVVLPDDGFREAAIDWARGIASQPRPALVAAKRAIIDGLRVPLSEGLRLEAQLFAECQSDPATLALQDRIRERYRETPPDVPVRF